MHTTLTRLRTRKVKVAGLKGFAMMDVLIAIVIFGIIVALAVVGYGKLKQQASASGTSSDASAFATTITSAANTGGGSFPAKADLVITKASGSAKEHITDAAGNIDQYLSAGNTIGDTYTVVPVSATNPTAYFTFCIEHIANGAADSHTSYDSSKGGIQETSSKGGC